MAHSLITFYLVFSNYNRNLKMLKSLIFFVILFTGISCQFEPEKHKNWSLLPNQICGHVTSSRIIGGKEVPMNSYPWIAVIAYSRPDSSKLKFACGGTLITKGFVITAAHCVSFLGNYKMAFVRLGEHNLETDPDCEQDFCADPVKDIKPAAIIAHEKYSKKSHNHDIALIKLEKEIEFTSFVKPICLPRGEIYKKNYEKNTAEVAGWGVSNLGANETYFHTFFCVANVKNGTPKLQMVTLPIISIDKCKKYVPRSFEIGEGQLCAGGVKNKDSCDGDSGGPFMKVEETETGPLYFLIGLVSFGPEQCGKENNPAIYTKISYYMNWILSNIGGDTFEARVEKWS